MRRKMATIGSTTIMLFLGLIYAWSIFVAPLENEFGWTRDETSLTFTICMSLFCIGGLSASQFRKKLNVTVILVINAIVILIAFLLTSKVTSLFQLYLYYGVLCGFSIGCAYNCILSVIPLYYPKRIGMINGVILLAYGLGGLILGGVAENLIIAFEWRATFVYIGILLFLVIFVLGFFVRVPKEEIHNDIKSRVVEDTGVPPGQMVKHPYFWMFAIWQTAVSSMGLAVIGHAASIASESGIKVSLIALAVGVVSASSGVGKLILGILYDLKGRATTLTFASVIGFVGVAMIYMCLENYSLPLLLIGFFCCGASFGGAPACNATFTRKQFGNKHFSVNFAINSMALLIAAFLGTYLIGAIRVGNSNYGTALIVLAVYMIISIVAAQLMRKEKA